MRGLLLFGSTIVPIEIVDVIWQEDTSGMTTVQSAVKLFDTHTEAGGTLRLRHKGRLIELNVNSQPFMMGREASNGLVA